MKCTKRRSVGVLLETRVAPRRDRSKRMIWFEIGVVVYTAVGLFLLALCRAASWADREAWPAATHEVRSRRAA